MTDADGDVALTIRNLEALEPCRLSSTRVQHYTREAQINSSSKQD